MFRPLKDPAREDIQNAIIANSAALAVGDVIQGSAAAASKFVTGAANTTGPVLGVVLSIVGANGLVLEKNSVTVASDNQTVGLISVNFLPLWIPMEYEADLTAAAGTTTGSGGIGSFNMDSATNGKLLESGYVAATAAITSKQFISRGSSDTIFPGGSNTRVVGHFNPRLIN